MNSNIRLVVFDWAGTTVDHGCFGPLAAFKETLARFGVFVSAAEVRAPMGLDKKQHLRMLIEMPAVRTRWHAAQGRDWNESDLDNLYQTFRPLQMEAIGNHCGLVPGALACLKQLRGRGIKIGATTGYFQEAAERVYRAAERQDFLPDVCVCAAEVPEGRPAPWMVFRIMERMDIFPPAAIVKVGDTVPDIHEGLNAGAWSVGVTEASSDVGCTEQELAALGDRVRQQRLSLCRARLIAAGAHAVIDNLTELPRLIDTLSGIPRRVSPF